MSKKNERYIFLLLLGNLLLYGCAIHHPSPSAADKLFEVKQLSAILLINIVQKELSKSSCNDKVVFLISLSHLKDQSPIEWNKIIEKLQQHYPTYTFLDKNYQTPIHFIDSKLRRRIVLISISDIEVNGTHDISCIGTIQYGALDGSEFVFHFQEKGNKFTLKQIEPPVSQ